MLAYSPLHWLLLAQLGRPLVMTSGNKSGSPTCIANENAEIELIDVADGFLLHNREIVRRCDDSVVSIIDNKTRQIRRARGYVPNPIKLPNQLVGDNTVLALGADLKNTFCLTIENNAILSAHNGGLTHVDCFNALQLDIAAYQKLLGTKPNAIAIDLHPNYLSSCLGKKLAKEAQIPVITVQHHHAHLAACLVENTVELKGPVLGIILDGLGYGDDGNLWGGEFLLADYHHYQRIAHFRPFHLLGGDKASKQPWRNLAALLSQSQQWRQYTTVDSLIMKQLASSQTTLLLKMADQFPKTSSVGRLIDAVAALLNIAPKELSFEGEAAVNGCYCM